MTDRLDIRPEWPLRPWITATLCALAGLLVHLLIDQPAGMSVSAPRQAAAAFVAVTTLTFVVTVERVRWSWAAAFAFSWGLVTAFVGWSTASYNRAGAITEFPFFSSLFALLLAAPLFQTARDEAAWRCPPARLESHVWSDAVVVVASLLFTGAAFLLGFLIASLFDLIGIAFFKKLLEQERFGWMLAGLAFGGAFGLLRERDHLVASLPRFAMAALSVLAPVLAVALLLLLLSIPFTGLSGLWNGPVSAAALLLATSGGAIVLSNAVFGDRREDRPLSQPMRLSALVLVVAVLPLSLLAGAAIGLRVGQYGWTPDRIWGAVVVGAGLGYGVGGWWSVGQGGRDFDKRLRPLQARLAIVLCGLALFLAQPIVDFGAIAARSQVARIGQEGLTPEAFDWAAMAFDFGPAGRRRLGELARSAPVPWRERATAALQANERWRLAEQTRAAAEAGAIAGRLRALSPDATPTADIVERVARSRLCARDAQCGLIRLDAARLVLLVADGQKRRVESHVIDLRQQADGQAASSALPAAVDLDKAQVEVRSITRRQIHIDGRPVGKPFD